MPTTNPVPSQDPIDLVFNAGKIDEVVNSTSETFTDRLGAVRKTVAGAIAPVIASADAALIDIASDVNVVDAARIAGLAEINADVAAIGGVVDWSNTYQGGKASSPTTRNNGAALQNGDIYFNTGTGRMMAYASGTWYATETEGATDADLVGYDGGTVQDVLDSAKPIADYTALRAYTGRATTVRITTPGIAGFFTRDSDVVTADNGGTVIVDGAERRWKRVFDGAVNVGWFGAVGDGVVDDTSAVQDAINASSKVEFDPGNYLVTSDIRVASYSIIDGNGAALKCGAMASQSPMLANKNIDATGYAGNTNITIRNLNFDLQNTTNGGIAIAHAQNILIENCTFLNTAGNFHFIDLPAVRNVVVQNCVFEISTSSTMLQIDQAATGSLPTINAPFLNADNTVSTDVRIVNNTFKNSLFAGAVHLHKDGHSDIVISGNHFEECVNGVQDDAGYATGSSRIVISNNTFDTRSLATGHGVVFYGANLGLTISGNTFNLPAANAGAIYLLGNDGQQNTVSITGNTIYNASATAIAVQSVTRCTITGNTINSYGSLAGSRYGIQVTNGTAVSISGNVVASPGAAVLSAINLTAITDFAVSGNEITAGAIGIHLDQSEDGVVSGNMFNTVGSAVRQIKSGGAAENITVTGNTIKNCTDDAISFDNIAYAAVTGNCVRDGAAGKMGFKGLSASAITVTGNVFAAQTNMSAGVYIDGAGYNIINGNRVRGATTGIQMIGTDNVITNNLLTSYTTAIVSGSGSPVVANNRTV